MRRAGSCARDEINEMADGYASWASPRVVCARPFECGASQVCGGCKDFKLIVTVPLATFGPWEEAGHPPETDFLEKLKAIEGASLIETQTITSAFL